MLGLENGRRPIRAMTPKSIAGATTPYPNAVAARRGEHLRRPLLLPLDPLGREHVPVRVDSVRH